MHLKGTLHPCSRSKASVLKNPEPHRNPAASEDGAHAKHNEATGDNAPSLFGATLFVFLRGMHLRLDSLLKFRLRFHTSGCKAVR